MALTAAQKQAAFRARRAEAGLKSRTVFIPAGIEADLVQIAQFLCEHPGYKFGPLMGPDGKLVNPFKPMGTKGRRAKRAEAAAIRASRANTVSGARMAA